MSRVPVLSAMSNRTAGLAAAVALAAATLTSAPANAEFTIPVTCTIENADSGVVLALDDVTYELLGTCGTVRITADDVTAIVPASTELLVEGDRAHVKGKPTDQVLVSGADAVIEMVSARSVTVTGSGAAITSPGILENVLLEGAGASLAADRVHKLKVRDADSQVVIRRGYDARVIGDGHALDFTRLDRLRVRGDDNSVSVAKGRTNYKVRGTNNSVEARKPR